MSTPHGRSLDLEAEEKARFDEEEHEKRRWLIAATVNCIVWGTVAILVVSGLNSSQKPLGRTTTVAAQCSIHSYEIFNSTCDACYDQRPQAASRHEILSAKQLAKVYDRDLELDARSHSGSTTGISHHTNATQTCNRPLHNPNPSPTQTPQRSPRGQHAR